MNDLAIEVAKQVPSLAVLVYLVRSFLTHLKESEENCRQTSLETATVVKDVKESCHEFCSMMHESTTEALHEMKGLVARTNEVMGRAIHVIETKN